MSKKSQTVKEAVEILQIEKVEMSLYVLGQTPLIMNRLPKKAREHLLMPMPRQNKAALESRLKHDPIAEFRDSVYRCRDDKAPTLVHLPNGCFKKAMAQAAIDIPGATKAQIGRLVSSCDTTIHLYGVPFLDMKIVRQAGINRTPDVRTRAVFPAWACKITLGYIRRLVSERDVLNLASAAGLIAGVGDWRPEKGSGDFGQWQIVQEDNSDWQAIVAKQGRKAQIAALDNPQAYDAETDELLAWFQAELIKRDRKTEAVQVNAPARKRKSTNGEGAEA